MSELVQKVNGKEFLVLSYPFSSNWKATRFQRRCLDLGGILQSGQCNDKRDIMTVTVLLPVEKIEEFKTLEAQDDKEAGEGFKAPSFRAIIFSTLIMAVAVAFFYGIYLFVGGY